MKFEIFLEMLYEAKKDAIGVYPGRFQGLTIGHAKIAKIMKSAHKSGYFVMVRGKKTDPKRNPFPIEVQKKMIQKVLGNKFKPIVLEGSFVNAFLDAVKSGKIKGTDFVIYAGPDRVTDYRRLVKYFKEEGLGLAVVDAEQMHPREEGISGTQFREALKNDDFAAFKKVAPKEIYGMFEELKKYVV